MWLKNYLTDVKKSEDKRFKATLKELFWYPEISYGSYVLNWESAVLMHSIAKL